MQYRFAAVMLVNALASVASAATIDYAEVDHGGGHGGLFRPPMTTARGDDKPKAEKAAVAEKQWPSFFPRKCPKAGAPDADGIVYRIVSEFNPDRSPGAPAYLLNPRPLPLRPEYFYSHTRAGRGDPNKCSCSGLSVYRDLTKLKEVRDAAPLFQGAHIAQAALDASHGKIEAPRESDSHCNLWIYASVSERAHVDLFSVVPE